MKSIFFYIILYFLSSTAHAQAEVDYIASYNRHIDPTGKLDAIVILSMQVKSDINYTLNFTTKQIKSIRNCSFYSDGSTQCIDTDNNGSKNFELPNIPEEDGGNAIKTQLNFIKIKETDVLSFKVQSDSITIVEREMTPSHKYLYTFDSKTKDLLQIKRINKTDAETYVSYTDFKGYQEIDGIIIPKNITFSNNFSIATLEYLDLAIEFK